MFPGRGDGGGKGLASVFLGGADLEQKGERFRAATHLHITALFLDRVSRKSKCPGNKKVRT